VRYIVSDFFKESFTSVFSVEKFTFTLEMEAARSPNTSVTIRQITRCHIPEYINFLVILERVPNFAQVLGGFMRTSSSVGSTVIILLAALLKFK
jgi:hypothetical protein